MRTPTFREVPRRTLVGVLSVLLTVAGASDASAQSTAAAADSTAVVATVQRLFDAMAKRDTVAARALLLPGSQFISVRSGGPATGNPQALVPRRQSDTTFLRSLATGRERLLERFWAPVVRLHGPLAEVWTPYDFHIDGRFSHCGIDTATLLRTAAGWRISALAYTTQRQGCAPSPLGPPPGRP